MSKEDNKNEKKYKHIVNGKIVDMVNDHPYSGMHNKTIFVKMLAEDLGISEGDYFDISGGNNNLFLLLFDNNYYNIFVETTDGGGADVSKNKTRKKVAIPFHIVAFNELIENREPVLVINIYIPLDDKFQPLDEKRVYLVIDPKAIYNSKVINKPEKVSSSRWVRLEEMLNISNQKEVALNKKENVYIVSRQNIKEFLKSELMTMYKNMVKTELEKAEYNEIINNYANEYNKYRSFFRECLIWERGIRCEIFNCEIKIPQLLIASHIKPVNKIIKSKIDNKSKIEQILDVDNGFLFCRNHDGLFDRFLITFDENGVLHSSDLVKDKMSVLNLTDGEKYVNIKNEKMKKYLKFHYGEFAKK